MFLKIQIFLLESTFEEQKTPSAVGIPNQERINSETKSYLLYAERWIFWIMLHSELNCWT